MSDPIRSIRVATALAERFRALIGTGAGSTSALELAIGEADQVYPEIWAHLVDARNALAAMDRDVAEFDRLRRDELTYLGVTDISAQAHVDTFALMQGRLKVVKVKNARFNFAGYQSAVAAAQALVAAMPEVDWDALARAEEREIRAAGSLRTRVWLAGVKWLVLAATVIGASVLIYRLVMTGERSAGVRSARAAAAVEGDDGAARIRAQVQARVDRIEALRGQYAASCDRALVPELAALLRENAMPRAAQEVETAPCVPARPTCDDVRAAIVDRVAAQHGLTVDQTLKTSCTGVVIGAPGSLVRGLAVVLGERTAHGAGRTLRGVTTADGTDDLVAFAPAPADVDLIGVADLDRDDTDEIVLAGAQELFVTRIVGGVFVDVAGPAMHGTCAANINLEADFRDGRRGEHEVLVLHAGPGGGAKCLAPGRHYFDLVNGELVESSAP